MSATATAFAAMIASSLRRQSVRWKKGDEVATRPDVQPPQRPLLVGHYRGRPVQMDQAGEWLMVTVRVENRAGIFAEFDHRSTADYFWLPSSCRRRLSGVAARWSVAVRNRTALLSCVSVEGPERLRFALDVACDVADMVDLSNSFTRR